jgi:hypothetical protein
MLNVPQTVETSVHSASEVDALLAERDARLAALEAAGGGAVSSIFNLFGPAQGSGALVNSSPPSFTFPGSALTANTKRLPFHIPHKQVQFAAWTLTWTPNSANNVCRLVHFDPGPTNIVEICRINGSSIGTPTTGLCDITVAINALIAAQAQKHIGHQFWGDGVTAWTLYSSHIELVFTA